MNHILIGVKMVPSTIQKYISLCMDLILNIFVNLHQNSLAINDIFSLNLRCCGPKRNILDYWGTLTFCVLSYYIIFKDKGL